MQLRSQIAAWYRASRPRTLTATYVPLVLAAVIAIDHGVFLPVQFALALLGALFLQAGANLVNEYFDFRRGADELKIAGQGMIIKNQVLTPELVLRGAIVTVTLGALIGLLLLAQSGPPLLWIGLGGVLVVILYTAGPFPLAYNGLGEVTVFIFMGPLMVLGAYYVMARELSIVPVLASLPIAFTVAAIMLANNIRDIDADRAANKRTLAVLVGSRQARSIYVLLIIGGYASLVLLVLAGIAPWPALVACITIPEAVRLAGIITRSDETQLLHQAQGRTARLHGRFGFMIALGWAVWLLARAVL
ncbi:MAG: 1,4-dihydroxy-2-naphthoate octaprenyltransferase [Chloroflexota bacterium]